MTIEEKAKAYDEALERAKNIKSKILQSHLSTESCKAVSEYINEIIPELRESEDERTRKNILALVKKHAVNHERCQMEAYLEKQKEQKHVEWSEKEHKLLNYAISLTDDAEVKTFLESLRNQPKQEWSEEDEMHRKWILEYLYDGLSKADEQFKDHFTAAIIWLGKQKEKSEKPIIPGWSEEDERIRCNLMSLLADMRGYKIAEATYQKYYPWLKRFRPQPHWRPSKEQMDALRNSAYGTHQNGDGSILRGLYADLQRL